MSLRTAWASNQVGPAIVSGVSTQGPLPARRSTAEGGGVDGAAEVAGAAADAVPAVGGGLVPWHAASNAPRLSRPPAASRRRRPNSASPSSTRRTVRGQIAVVPHQFGGHTGSAAGSGVLAGSDRVGRTVKFALRPGG